jgi:DNA-binding protein H-NS
MSYIEFAPVKRHFRCHFWSIDLYKLSQQYYFTHDNGDIKTLSRLNECIEMAKEIQKQHKTQYGKLIIDSLTNLRTEFEQNNAFPVQDFRREQKNEHYKFLSKNGFCGSWCGRCNTHYCFPKDVQEKAIRENQAPKQPK